MGADRELTIKVVADTGAANRGLQETANTVKSVSDNTEEGAEHIEGFNLHGREMFRLGMELNRILPGLGELVRAIANPEVAGMFALIAGFTYLIEYLKSGKQEAEGYAEAIQKLVDNMASLDTTVWLNQIEGENKATEAAEGYAAKLREVKALLDGIKEEEGTNKAVAGEKGKQDQDLIKAQEAAELKKLEQDEKNAAAGAPSAMRGAIREQFAAKREAIRQKYANQSLITTAVDEVSGVEADAAALAKRQQREPGLEVSAKAAEDAVTADTANKDRIAREAKLVELRKEQDRLAQLAESARHGDKFKAETVGEYANVSPTNAQFFAEDARRRFGETNQQVQADKAHTKDLEAHAKELEQARDENIKAINEQSAAIRRQTAILETRFQGEMATAAAGGNTGVMNLLKNILDHLGGDKTRLDNLQGQLRGISGIGTQ